MWIPLHKKHGSGGIERISLSNSYKYTMRKEGLRGTRIYWILTEKISQGLFFFFEKAI